VAAARDSAVGSAQVGVGGNGKRPGVDRRAPGVRIDAAKRQRPTTGLNKSTRSGHDSRKRSACVVVSAAAPSVTVPTPASEPIAWPNPLRSRVAPDATVKALFGDKAFAAPALTVPWLIKVARDYPLFPDSVRTPAPVLARLPGPLIWPEKVVLKPFVSTVPPLSMILRAVLNPEPN